MYTKNNTIYDSLELHCKNDSTWSYRGREDDEGYDWATLESDFECKRKRNLLAATRSLWSSLPRSLIFFSCSCSETHCRPHWPYIKGSVELGSSAVAWCPEHHHRWFDKDAGRLLRRTRTAVCRKDQDENFFYEEVTFFMRS